MKINTLPIFAAAVFATVPAWAQPLESVTVTGFQTATAGKDGARLLDTPQNIQVVSSDLLRDQNASLDDALRNVAGVEPGGYYSAWDYFRIRGFDASGYIYQDGLAFDSGVQLNAELYGLEQIEIMKGPSSALYGAGSLGGLVNLVSKRPRAGTFLTMGASGGSFGSWDVHLDGGTALPGTPDVLVRLVATQRRNGIFTRGARGDDRTYIAPSLTWLIDEATSLTVLASYQHDDAELTFPLTYIGAVVDGPGGRYPLDTNVGEPGRSNFLTGNREAIGTEFRHRFNSALSFEQNARYAYNNNVWDHMIYPSHLDDDQRTLERYPYSATGTWLDYGIDSRLRAEFATGPVQHNLIGGVDHFSYTYNWHSSEIDYGDPAAYIPLDLYKPVYGTPFPAFTTFMDVREILRDTGLYLQDHVQYGRLGLTLSGRWDFTSAGDSWSGTFSTHDDNHFVPRLGATYEIVPQIVAYTSYSESFKPQSGSTLSGAPLKPETGQQWEAGVKTDLLDGRLDLTASLFELTRQNVATEDLANPGFSVQTGEQRSRGFELDGRARLAPGWQAILTYAYIDAQVTKDNVIPVGDRPLNVPPASIGLWSKYELQDGPLKGLSFGGGIYRYASQWGDLPNSFKLPAYTLVNGLLRYDFGQFSLQLNAENLLNQRYFTGSYNAVYVQPGAPQNFNIRLDWEL